MAQNINNQDERVNQLAREIFISAGGRVAASEAFHYAERFIDELSSREAEAKVENERRVQDLLARSRLLNCSTGGI